MLRQASQLAFQVLSVLDDHVLYCGIFPGTRCLLEDSVGLG